MRPHRRQWNLATLLAAAPALATPPRAAVERLLSGYELPARDEDWRRLGDGVDKVLIDIAEDSSTAEIRRNRALSALALFPSPEARDYLATILRRHGAASEGAEMLHLVAAARALGNFGASAVELLRPLLAHPMSDVRATAARALARTRATGALAALQQALRAERDEEVVLALRSAIDQLARP